MLYKILRIPEQRRVKWVIGYKRAKRICKRLDAKIKSGWHVIARWPR